MKLKGYESLQRIGWRLIAGLLLFMVAGATSSCSRKSSELPVPDSESIFKGEGLPLERVGSIVITETDLKHLLKENYGGRSDEASRSRALDFLVRRAHFTQAALDSGLANDPVVRAELARLLERRLRETQLDPQISALATAIPESRLRPLYTEEGSRFVSPEKRKVAVLWLKPGADPERKKAYMAKLNTAREWVFSHELKEQPEQGFGMLSVDYSEHHATRFKQGVLGWLKAEGNSSAWNNAVAEIVFSLEEEGAVSEVVSHAEGLFLVRYMARQPPLQKSFDEVKNLLEREERNRKRLAIESDFEKKVLSK